MKKNRFILWSLCFLFAFSSCSKNTDEQQKSLSNDINSFFFELARYSITGECDLENPEQFYYPPQFDLFVKERIFECGQNIYLLEKYFPQKIGLIEGSGFYIPENDDGKWVDELLLSVEESRIADMILEMEEAHEEAQNIPVISEDYKKNIENALDENAEAVEMAGKDSSLRIMQFNDEIFIPYQNENYKITIEANENEVNRKFYDADYRLLKNEKWQIKSLSDSVLVESEEYLFNEGSVKPYEKTVRSKSEFSHTFYNESGVVVKTEKYVSVVKDKSGKKESEKETEDKVVSVFEWSYNDSGKIEKEVNTVYYYDKDYKKLDYVFEKKHLFTYNDFSDVLSEEDNERIPANFEYYEDNVLKMKNKYSAELGSYTSQVFFDNDFSVKSTYNKYKLVKEVYTSGSEVIRINEYE